MAKARERRQLAHFRAGKKDIPAGEVSRGGFGVQLLHPGSGGLPGALHLNPQRAEIASPLRACDPRLKERLPVPSPPPALAPVPLWL